jgi:hypothetical protein
VSIITLPSALLFGPETGVGQQRYDMSSVSDATGAGQDRTFGPPRWALTLASPSNLKPAEGALWEQLVIKLRGRLNHLAAHDPGKPAPLGTRRGALVLGAGAAIGATTIGVTGAGTLLAGDWLQIGSGLGSSQLVKVADDTATATVYIEPPLRMAFSAGELVTWDKPVGYYKMVSQPGKWTYAAGGLQRGFALDLLERFA